MVRLQIRSGNPTPEELRALELRCKLAIERLRRDDSEAKFPLFIEFAGSPKSGKSSIIGIVAHFLRRQRIRIAIPPEGASLRTPEALKDDWLAFNAWSGCYALQNILVDCFLDPPIEIVLLDRGLLDVAAWMTYLNSHLGRISDDDRSRIIGFFGLDFWRRRENMVFVFTADHPTSLSREADSKLSSERGSVMNELTLAALNASYEHVVAECEGQYQRVVGVDSSFRNGEKPSFQMIAFQVADMIVRMLEDTGIQELLVTEETDFEGFRTEPQFIEEFQARILRDGSPRFLERDIAEHSNNIQQIVPYAILKNSDGRYFRARRRADAKRKELQKKLTLLVGGHAERRDWSPTDPKNVFESCLRRELDEELVDIRIESIRPLGFLYEPYNPTGSLHVGFIHEVVVGGRVGIRRQAVDKEFGRESVEWVDEQAIRDSVGDLDPWSQRVASKCFGASMPPQENLFAPSE